MLNQQHIQSLLGVCPVVYNYSYEIMLYRLINIISYYYSNILFIQFMKLDHIDVFSLFILRSLGVILFFLLGSWGSLGKDSDTTFTSSSSTMLTGRGSTILGASFFTLVSWFNTSIANVPQLLLSSEYSSLSGLLFSLFWIT